MSQIIPNDLVDGDALEPWHINFIFRFIRRWMKFDVSPPLNLDNSGNAPPHLSLFALDDLVPVLIGSGGLTAGSYSSPVVTPGTGTVTLLNEYQDGPDFTTTAGQTGTCYNPYTTAISGTKFAWAKWRGPYLYLVVADC